MEPTPLSGLSLIGDQIGNPNPADTFQAVSRITAEPLAPVVHSAHPHEIEIACSLAAAAARILRWTDPARIADLLDDIARRLEADADAIYARAHQETALPLARLQVELARTTGQLRFFAQIARIRQEQDLRHDEALPDRQPVPRPDLYSLARPVGPVAVFGASNFPLAFSVAGGDTASALAAGCPVIVKAHPAHPGTSELVGRHIQAAVSDANLPAGTFSLLFDQGLTVGEALVKNPQIRAVGFTGSRRGGLALTAIAQARPVPIPVFAEMGSVNPSFVFPHLIASDTEAFAAALANSATMGVGQFCTNPGLVILIGPEDKNDLFIRAYSEAMKTKPCATMLTPGIAANYLQELGTLAAQPGVTPHLYPSDALEGHPAVLSVSASDFIANPKLQTEVFGPCTLLVLCPTLSEAAEIAENLEGQLTASLHFTPTDEGQARLLLPLLEEIAGRILVNQFPTGLEVANATVHGGPFPATTAPSTTSVGARAMHRWLRPICYQNLPPSWRPH